MAVEDRLEEIKELVEFHMVNTSGIEQRLLIAGIKQMLERGVSKVTEGRTRVAPVPAAPSFQSKVTLAPSPGVIVMLLFFLLKELEEACSNGKVHGPASKEDVDTKTSSAGNMEAATEAT
jgi:hypothetical protein